MQESLNLVLITCSKDIQQAVHVKFFMPKLSLLPFLAVILALFYSVGNFMLFSTQNELNIQAGQNKIKLTKIRTFENAHKGTFSPDGKLLAVIGRDYVDIVEISDGHRLVHIAPDKATMLGARFSPDGRILATASKIIENSQTNPFKVTLWNVSTGKEKLSLPIFNDEWYRVIDDLSFSKDGELLASNLGGRARLWKTSDGSEASRFLPPDDKSPAQSERVLLSPNGQWLAVYCKNDQLSVNVIQLLNLATDQRIDLATNVYRDWEFSSDSRFLAVTAIQRKGHSDEHSAVEIWDINSGQRRKIVEVPNKWRGAFTVTFSPDATTLAIGGYKKFGLFSRQSGNLLAEAEHAQTRFFEDREQVYQIADTEFSPDGSLLLTGGNDGRIKLWKVSK